MSTRQLDYHDLPTGRNVVIGRPSLSADDNHHQPRGEERKSFDWAIAVDPDEQGAAEQRARAAQRITALGEMTAGIAHDFRNVLTVIGSALRLAERSSRDPAKLSACIAGAREGVERGVQLTSQLLTFAKQQELDARAADANECLRNLEPFLKYGAGPGIRVVLELASDLPECLIDPSQFTASMLNLVVNARDAMPNGGDIHISTERCEVKAVASGSAAPSVYVRVRVKDSGQGMPTEVLQKIFDPLFTTKGEKGTGLGIPQVCAFMRLIGGYVRVASEPGIGTAFDLLFPAGQHQTEPSHRRTDAKSQSSGSTGSSAKFA